MGAAATLLETGESVSVAGSGHFPMQSVYKFPIAMALLDDVDRGAIRLDQQVTVTPAELVPAGLYSPIRDAHPQGGFSMTVGELLRYAVAESDGTASDVCLRLAGGPGPVMAYLKTLGVAGVMVATSENQMGHDEMVQYRNWAAPEQMVVLLAAFQRGAGLSAASHDLLLRWMTETARASQRLKGLLPEGTVVAHKPGSSGMHDGLARATNDVGLITLPGGRHIAIAVFVSDSRADEAARELVIAKIARAAWDHWAGAR